MNFENLFTAALLGAVFTAIGVGLGAIIAQRLPDRFRSLILAVFAVAGVVMSQIAGDVLKSRTLKAEIRTELQKNRIFVIVEKEFPEEYVEFVHNLSRAEDVPKAREMGGQFITNLRKTHARHIKSASRSKLLDMMEADRQLTRTIREASGDEVCNTFLLAGPNALPSGMAPYTNRAELSIEALLLAVVDGRQANRPRRSPSESDLDELMADWQSDGATDDMISAIANPETAGIAFCGYYLSFLSFMLSYEASNADVIRAEFLYRAAIAE